MKKVTDLKENEGILCQNIDEAKAMYELLKIPVRENQLKIKVYPYVIYPNSELWNASAKTGEVYLASDFLTPTYTVTREMLKDIANQNEHLTYECERFISSKFDIFTSSVYLNTTDIESYYDEAEDNRNEDEHQLLALLFPNYEKPKQKREITVWVNVYDNYHKIHFNEVFAKSVVRAKGQTVEGKLTYKI